MSLPRTKDVNVICDDDHRQQNERCKNSLEDTLSRREFVVRMRAAPIATAGRRLHNATERLRLEKGALIARSSAVYSRVP